MEAMYEVAIIGGGQAGLATAHHLQRLGVSHVVLEAGSRAGDSWRRRWDSLRLFTPARYDGLPGMPFPASPGSFPTKDEMADYLEAYADRFSLNLRLGARARAISARGELKLVQLEDGEITARQVVVATGAYRTPVLPAWASQLDPAIAQIHAAEYRGPAQLPKGPILVVGAGNSGSEIAIEAARAGRRTWLAGRSVGRIPPVMYGFGGRIFWFFANHVASRRNPLGRRVLARMAHHGGPLIRLSESDVTSSGVTRVGRVAGVDGGRPLLDDGRTLEVAGIVWCTGFGRDPLGQGEPGIHFVGVPFQSRMASAFIGGVGADARDVAERIKRSAGDPGDRALRPGPPERLSQAG